MNNDKNVLPEDFDGTFRFTNPDDEEFIGKWGGKAYIFPPQKTVPMIIMDASPLEIQNIRKKFAKELAEKMFFKGDKYKGQVETRGTLNSIHQAGVYSESDLKVYIQQCLTALPRASQKVTELPKENMEEKLHKDEEGELITTVVDKKTSLRKKALEA